MSDERPIDVADDFGLLPPNELLREMLRSKRVPHPSGNQLELTSTTSPLNYAALYRHVVARRPSLVIEIGMAYGASALSILTALAENGGGRLISIDPYPQWSSAMEAALHLIRQAGFEQLHEHIREPSCAALPRLVSEYGQRAELVYIDGQHTFDHAFIDCFYGDRLLTVGGALAFNDCGWRSVFRVLKFLKTHRKYREIDVGNPRQFRGGNWLKELVARLEGRSALDRYFEKVEDWSPPYSYYRSF
jgi:predicted O-methyltransferase YrrM